MTAFSFLLIFLHILMPQQDPVRSLRHYIDSNRVFGQYIFPILLALILGILPFHNELSRDHVDFLMSYPVTAGKVFRTKYFFNILMLFFLVLASYMILPAPIIYEQYDTPNPILFIFLLPPVLTLLFYTASFLSALLIRNAFAAIFAVPFILIAEGILACPLLIALGVLNKFTHILLILLLLSIISFIFAYFVWRYSVSRHLPVWRILLFFILWTISGSWALHGFITIITKVQLMNVIQNSRASGMSLSMNDILPPPILPDRDGALTYRQAFTLHKKLQKNQDFARSQEAYGYMAERTKRISPSSRAKPIPQDEFERIRRIEKDEFWKEKAPQIFVRNPESRKLHALILRASSFPGYSFEEFYTSIQHLDSDAGRLMRLRDFLFAHAYILLKQGIYDEATSDILTLLAMGDAFRDMKIYESYRDTFNSNGISILQFALLTTPEMFTKEKCIRFMKVLSDKKMDGKAAIEETATVRYNLFYKKILERTIPLSEYFLAINGYYNDPLPFWPWLGSRIRLSFIFRPLMMSYIANDISMMTECQKLANKPFYEIRDSYDIFVKRMTKETSKAAPLILFENYYILGHYGDMIINRQNRSSAYIDTMQLTLAIYMYKKIHGKYPDSLGMLVSTIMKSLPEDPFSGNDYIYRREGDGFIVYSVGPNQKDNDGYLESTEIDDIAHYMEK